MDNANREGRGELDLIGLFRPWLKTKLNHK